MVEEFWVSGTFEYWTGIVALLFQAWLTGASWGPFRYAAHQLATIDNQLMFDRNLGYEFFKVAHFISAVAFMVTFFWHCAGTLTSWYVFHCRNDCCID